MKDLKKQNKILILCAPAVLGLALLLYLNITGTGYITLWPCPLLEISGLACPGCGATRCICSILTFRFYDALRYNLAVFILFFYLGGVYLYCFYKVIRFNKFIKISIACVLPVIILIIMFALIRNFSFYPWHLASPYK